MKFNVGLLPVALSSLLLTSSASSVGDVCCRGDVTTSSYHQKMLDQYLSVWDGDLSLVKSTFHPDVKLYSDRFPSSTGNGSTLTEITNREQFAAFVEKSRDGWSKYTFDPIRWVSSGHQIVVRWKMEGVLGSNFTLFPTPLAAGSSVTYNGTDFLVLDECTGLIREDYIAQDLITYFHAMGLSEIAV
ncbi:hypothetical protein N7466_006822 [Penicillium verhagenii]|uniref:uncharacterized protein n=1 Tax=Penicillium verhagenii TaxID=1562060 RepID=UPI0025458290|nr:uncharacterized protein N7466_006822 [Penicillium verhagenii]KAJ5927866.1 hypothetical protein N7466_006822 [Penicillium verhagenii]